MEVIGSPADISDRATLFMIWCWAIPMGFVYPASILSYTDDTPFSLDPDRKPHGQRLVRTCQPSRSKRTCASIPCCLRPKTSTTCRLAWKNGLGVFKAVLDGVIFGNFIFAMSGYRESVSMCYVGPYNLAVLEARRYKVIGTNTLKDEKLDVSRPIEFSLDFLSLKNFNLSEFEVISRHSNAEIRPR